MVPTHEQELRDLADMWTEQADLLEIPDADTDTITEAESDKAETLRHCASELNTLLNQGVLLHVRS